MKTLHIKSAVIGILLVLSIAEAYGQVTNTLFFMPGVPQANRVNPAIQPECGFYFGAVGMSPLRMEISNSAFAYEDIIQPHPFQDSLMLFLHPDADKQAFLDLFKPVNFFASDLGTSLLSFGFRVGDNFFSVDMTTRVDGNVYYPADMIKLALNGTTDGTEYTFDGLALDLQAFDEVSVGWSRPILSNLDVGVRAKFLFGIGTINTRNSELSLKTTMDTWSLGSDMDFQASLPFAEVEYDDEGNIEDIYLKEDLDDPDFGTIPKYLFNFKNFGFAADLGVNFRPIDRLQISASVSDLGFIKWNDEIHNINYRLENYDFNGIEVNPLSFSDDYTFEDLLDSTLTAIGDSLSGFLTTQPGSGFTRMLNTKLYAGASFHVIPNISFGVLSRTDFLNNKISQQFTASANIHAGRALNFSLAYSYINTYYKNLGVGLSINAGPLNLYLISDNALNIVFWPQEAQSANLWFGMNLVFGYKNFGQKEIKDKPMVY